MSYADRLALRFLLVCALVLTGLALLPRAARAVEKSPATKSTILAALLSLPTFYEDRGAELAAEKRAQLETVARAIRSASHGDKQLAALLIVIAYHESALSLRIHHGICKESECDHGKATSLFQLHSSARLPLDEWATLAGTDDGSTAKSAKAAAQMLEAAKFSCGSDPAFILTSYAGRRCSATDWAGLAPRMATFARVRSKL